MDYLTQSNGHIDNYNITLLHTALQLATWSVRSKETWKATKQSWKLEKTFDRVGQAKLQADH